MKFVDEIGLKCQQLLPDAKITITSTVESRACFTKDILAAFRIREIDHNAVAVPPHPTEPSNEPVTRDSKEENHFKVKLKQK